jgi:ABC-type bacteriocin/lantibiotic exporter with double-glycine peptidase domain
VDSFRPQQVSRGGEAADHPLRMVQSIRLCISLTRFSRVQLEEKTLTTHDDNLMVSVKFDAVTKILGQSRAVDKLTLEIGAGELFFLLGPSGCGKTTALRTVAGFYMPDEGRILFNDH